MLIVPDVSRYQPALTAAYARPAIIFRGAFGPSTEDARFLAFLLDLPAGPTELHTAFACKDQHERGAYYVYVERLLSD